MAHTWRCAFSRRPRSTCKCNGCGGRLHGTGRLSSSQRDTSTRAPSRKTSLKIPITITATITAGAITATATGAFDSPASGTSLSVKVNVDLNKVISTLSLLKYSGKQISTSGASAPEPEGCAKDSIKEVKVFLTEHPCKDYSADTWMIYQNNMSTQVAFSWVEMRTSSLARQYKTKVDAPGTGNPPGISSAFDGHCYASRRQGDTVWSAEVRPTGNKKVDQNLLESAVQENLSSDYLEVHCPE